MSTFSQTDLSERMLKDLGLIGAEEVPSASDLAWANETVTSEVALLSALELPIWNGSELSVPREYLTLLSLRCGLALAPSFGLMSQAESMAAKEAAERNLTVLAAPRGAMPLLARADDSTRGRGGYNWQTGL